MGQDQDQNETLDKRDEDTTSGRRKTGLSQGNFTVRSRTVTSQALGTFEGVEGDSLSVTETIGSSGTRRQRANRETRSRDY